MYKLYILSNKNDPSNIRYVGQTLRSLNERLSRHRRDKKTNKYKYSWIKSIGVDNVMIYLIEDNISLDVINDKERELIKICRELGYRLTNITDGGEGWKGMKLSEEHKRNVSLNHADVSGEKNPMYGKNHTQETIDKIKIAKAKWFKEIGFSEENLKNMSIRARGTKNPQCLLTEEAVLEIRKLSEQGVRNYILAQKYNMKVPAIWKIVNRYTWKHI